jgi:hypothetical protein
VNLRIAIGACSCASHAHTRNPLLRELCRRILARLSALNAQSPETLSALPPSRQEFERIDSKDVWLATYRESLTPESNLVVVQGFLPSWRFPRYFGPAGVGHMVADGIVSCAGKPNKAAQDALLWEFR